MLLASISEGETVILNAACEPEVVDLANALNLMGAKIEGAGDGYNNDNRGKLTWSVKRLQCNARQDRGGNPDDSRRS